MGGMRKEWYGCLRSNEVSLHDPMEDSMNPGEVVEKVQRAGQRGGGIEDEVVEHDDISLDAYNSASPADVGLEDMLVQEAG